MSNLKEILKFAIPIAINLILITIIGLTDIYVVSKYGTDAVSGVGIVLNIWEVLFSLKMVYESGGKILLTRYVGEKSYKKASIVISSLLVTSFILSFILILLFAITPKVILYFTNENKEVAHYVIEYGYILLFGIPFFLISTILNTAIHSYSDSYTPMYLALVAVVINTILDFGLGLGYFGMPNMGVSGVAISTVVSYIVVSLLYLYIYFTKKMPFIPTFRFNKVLFRKVLKRAIPNIGSNLLRTLSNLVLATALVTLGSKYYASFDITIKIMGFGYMSVIAFSIAGSILIGQKIGEKNYKEAKEVIELISKINVAIMVILSIFFITYAQSLAKMFSSDLETIELIAKSIISFAIIEIPFAIEVTYSFALNGAGLTHKTFKINMISLWGIRVTFALLAIYIFNSYNLVLFVYLVQMSLVAYLMKREFNKKEWERFKV